MNELEAVVLAAGQGKRMLSATPKVLHSAAGRPLVAYPVRAAIAAGASRVVVVTSPSTRDAVSAALAAALPGADLEFAVQEPPRGTGDAARVGLTRVRAERVMILCGDTPLLRSDDLCALVGALEQDPSARLALLSAHLDEPAGYGRVLRDADGRVSAIREHRDLASDAERAVREVNAGVYVADAAALRDALARIRSDNAQGELYLTDAVALLSSLALPGDASALAGVNDRAQLAAAEALLYRRVAERHAAAGVTVRSGARIDDTVVLEPDAVIESGVVLRGATSVGARAVIDVGSVVTDSVIGAEAQVKPYSVITSSSVGERAQIGPFAHLRPESVVEAEAHIGNFVETKKTRVRRGAKANHLAYLGDGDVGEGANVGAGTIFCNYDGFQKHETVIGEGAFIGSDSQLVAPVTVGKQAYVATGTTVTRDVPDGALAIGRIKQENKAGYASRLRARLAAQKRG